MEASAAPQIEQTLNLSSERRLGHCRFPTPKRDQGGSAALERLHGPWLILRLLGQLYDLHSPL